MDVRGQLSSSNISVHANLQQLEGYKAQNQANALIVMMEPWHEHTTSQNQTKQKYLNDIKTQYGQINTKRNSVQMESGHTGKNNSAFGK